MKDKVMSEKTAKALVVVSAIFLLLVGFGLYKLFEYQGINKDTTSRKIVNYDIKDYVETVPVVFNGYSNVYSKINVSRVTLKDLDNLKELATTIKNTSLCGLGKCAPNPILSTLNNFYDEYLSHVVDKKCPAGKCQSLLNYIITDACKGCTKCARVCPAKCITGKPKEKHEIDTKKCLKCGTCMSNCKFNAIIKV